MKIFLGGVAALVVGIILLIVWIEHLLTVILGLIPIILLVGGGFAAYSGYDEMKEKMAGEPEEFEPTFDTGTAETPAGPSKAAAGATEEEKPAKPRAARAPRKRRPKKKEA